MLQINIIKKFKIPKATKKSNCVPDTYANESPEESNNMQESIGENEVQKEYNRPQDSSSDNPEIFFNPQPSTSQRYTKYKHVHALHMLCYVRKYTLQGMSRGNFTVCIYLSTAIHNYSSSGSLFFATLRWNN